MVCNRAAVWGVNWIFFHGWKLLLEIQADGISVGVILQQLPVLANSILERPRHSALVQGTTLQCNSSELYNLQSMILQSMTALPS